VRHATRTGVEPEEESTEERGESAQAGGGAGIAIFRGLGREELTVGL